MILIGRIFHLERTQNTPLNERVCQFLSRWKSNIKAFYNLSNLTFLLQMIFTRKSSTLNVFDFQFCLKQSFALLRSSTLFWNTRTQCTFAWAVNLWARSLTPFIVISTGWLASKSHAYVFWNMEHFWNLTINGNGHFKFRTKQLMSAHLFIATVVIFLI